MAHVWLAVLLVMGLATGAVFAIDPLLDVQAALYFRDLSSRLETSGFPSLIEWFRALGPLVLVAAIAPAVITLIVKAFLPRRRAPMSSRAALFLILSLALGPGLLVNGLLKPYWPRARPYMIVEAPSEYSFTPWWDPRGTCDSNCSFVSGEVSGAAWLAAPAMLAPLPWRYAALGAVAVYGDAIAFIRLLAGGHFLSDVIFAAVLTGLVIWATHGMLFRWPPATRMDNSALDAALERCGSAMRHLFGLFGATARVSRPRPDRPVPPV